jgi:hypothetical protein
MISSELHSKHPGVLRLEFIGPKWCGDIGDAHPRFNVAGDDFKVADGGSLNFSSFDGIARVTSHHQIRVITC